MKKKPPEKVKLSSSKTLNKGVLTKSTGRVLQMAQKTTPKKSVADDPRYTQAVQNYEAGLRAMQEHKFDKAKGHLQKVIGGPSKKMAGPGPAPITTFKHQTERPLTPSRRP